MDIKEHAFSEFLSVKNIFEQLTDSLISNTIQKSKDEEQQMSRIRTRVVKKLQCTREGGGGRRNIKYAKMYLKRQGRGSGS